MHLLIDALFLYIKLIKFYTCGCCCGWWTCPGWLCWLLGICITSPVFSWIVPSWVFPDWLFCWLFSSSWVFCSSSSFIASCFWFSFIASCSNLYWPWLDISFAFSFLSSCAFLYSSFNFISSFFFLDASFFISDEPPF